MKKKKSKDPNHMAQQNVYSTQCSQQNSFESVGNQMQWQQQQQFQMQQQQHPQHQQQQQQHQQTFNAQNQMANSSQQMQYSQQQMQMPQPMVSEVNIRSTILVYFILLISNYQI